MPSPKAGYFHDDGSKVPSVTQILNRFKDPGGLFYWACEQGKAIQRGEISHLYEKRDQAADAGTLAHGMVESHIYGKPMPPIDVPADEVLAQASQGFENYLRWERDNRIVVVAQELSMVSQKHRFGGTPDAIGEDSSGDICLLDWKTSSGCYVEYLVQLAAYKMLWNEVHPELPITGGCHLLRFSKEHGDFHHHYWSDLSDAEEQFLLFLKAYELDKKLKKRL